MKNEQTNIINSIFFVGIIISVVVSCLITGIIWFLSRDREQKYDEASLFMSVELSNFESAYEIFVSLGGFRDSRIMSYEAGYQRALQLLSTYEPNVDEAKDWLRKIPEEYEDTPNILYAIDDYRRALFLSQQGNYEDTIGLLINADEYINIGNLLDETRYTLFEIQVENGSYLEAINTVEDISADSAQYLRAIETIHDIASDMIDTGQITEAITILDSLAKFDSSEKTLEDRSIAQAKMEEAKSDLYKNAKLHFDEGRYSTAMSVFLVLGDYLESVTYIARIEEIYTRLSLANNIAAGNTHSVGLTREQKVVTAGDRDIGVQSTDKWTDIISVAAGRLFTAGLDKNGHIFITGAYSDRLNEAIQWSSIVAIAAGNDFIIGLTENNTVLVDGDVRSRLGRNHPPNDNLRNAEEWEDIVSIAAGWRHIVGLTSTGEVLIVGDGADRQYMELEHLKSTGKLVDHEVIAIAAGGGYQDVEDDESEIYYITALLLSDGSVVVIGNIMESDKEQIMYGDNAWVNIKAISVGSWHIVGLTSEGLVLTTGSGYYDDIDAANSSYNIQNVTNWGTDSKIVEVAAGTGFTIGLKSNGEVVGVGYNADNVRNVENWPALLVRD